MKQPFRLWPWKKQPDETNLLSGRANLKRRSKPGRSLQPSLPSGTDRGVPPVLRYAPPV